MKKAIGWVVLAVVVFYVGTNPGPAADMVRGIASGAGQIVRNIGLFFADLAK